MRLLLPELSDEGAGGAALDDDDDDDDEEEEEEEEEEEHDSACGDGARLGPLPSDTCDDGAVGTCRIADDEDVAAPAFD